MSTAAHADLALDPTALGHFLVLGPEDPEPEEPSDPEKPIIGFVVPA